MKFLLILFSLNLHALSFSRSDLDGVLGLLDRPAKITLSGPRNLLGSCNSFSSFEKTCQLADTVIESEPLHALFWGDSGTTVDINSSLFEMAYEFTAILGGDIRRALPNVESKTTSVVMPDYTHAASGGRLQIVIRPSALGESLLDGWSRANLDSIDIHLGKQSVLKDINKKGDEIVAELEATQKLYLKGRAFVENSTKTLDELASMYASLADKDGEGGLPKIDFFNRFATLPPAQACPVVASPWSEDDPSNTQYECSQVLSIITLSKGFPSPFTADEVQGYRDLLLADVQLLQGIIQKLTQFGQGSTERFKHILEDLRKNKVIS